MSSIFKIQPTVQSYEWGKVGPSSRVAQLASASNLSGFELQKTVQYAELWMGAHPKSSSLLQSSKVSLLEYINDNPTLLGTSIKERYNSKLPFLFKVLSIEKALSIQTHPDIPTARRLHVEQPDIYKDDNHKPEMALALTPFEAMCGFRPLPEIVNFFNVVPELGKLPSVETKDAFLANPTKGTLKDVFSSIITASPDEALASIVARYRSSGASELEKSQGLVDLVLRIESQFPNDVGVFCLFILNVITLQPGEAIFLGAGEPHAYVSGDIMECMANSDNVIRAGLTPKLRDIPNLLACLTYEPAPPSAHFTTPKPEAGSKFSVLYNPPIPEFAVLQTKLPAGNKELQRSVEGPSISIVVEGSGVFGGLEVGTGDVVFVGAGTQVEAEAKDNLVIYRAFCEV
ncbi:mannose-6-phosphate isomerase [Flagelloscypha sp. PMI_526]|nr:mannose-6-phosphate isomerase [Flagelloscypha sp. PMI_526]